MEQLMHNLKSQIITQLNIVNKKPEDIDSDGPIFGDGMGLDSIDALELIVILENEYGIEMSSAEELTPHFVSVRALANFVIQNRKMN